MLLLLLCGYSFPCISKQTKSFINIVFDLSEFQMRLHSDPHYLFHPAIVNQHITQRRRRKDEVTQSQQNMLM